MSSRIPAVISAGMTTVPSPERDPRSGEAIVVTVVFMAGIAGFVAAVVAILSLVSTVVG